MVYGEDDLLWLEGNADDSLVLHKDSDIKPRHYACKTHGMECDANSGEAAAAAP